MTGDNVLLEVRDGIAHLTLNRPEAANGINDGLARDLLAATTAISLDDRVRVVLLSGNGPRFCGGGDVKAFAALGDELAANIRGLIPALHTAIALLVRGDAPVVAAVHGSAAGAGLGLRRRVRPRRRGGVHEVRDGVHGHRAHPRRLVELVRAAPRRRPARARAHAHEPRAQRRGGTRLGSHHQGRARRRRARRGGDARRPSGRGAAGRAGGGEAARAHQPRGHARDAPRRRSRRDRRAHRPPPMPPRASRRSSRSAPPNYSRD